MKMIQAVRARRLRESGFTMIEVLVALLLMAFGLLGIASLLLVTARSNGTSSVKQQALQTAYDVVDLIRANPSQVAAYAGGTLSVSGPGTAPSAPAKSCNTSTCSTTELAAYDRWYWFTSEVANLPNGSASIVTSVSGNNTKVVVTVQWDDSLAVNASAASGSKAVKLGTAASSAATNANYVFVTVQTLI